MLHKSNQVRIVSFVVMIVATSCAVHADDIRLHASVRLPDGADRIHLRDVAIIEGADALRFADLVLDEIDDPTSAQRITVEQVRRALDDAGVHWGRVNLSGRNVIARPGQLFVAAAAPAPMTEASLVRHTPKVKDVLPPADDVREAAAIIDEPTLRGAIARFICEGLAREPDAVELRFDPKSTDQLDQSANLYRFELKTEGSLNSDRVTLVARFWEGDRVVESHRSTIELRLRTNVAMLQRDLRRDRPVALTDISHEMQWLPPSEAAQAIAPDQLAGQLATSNLSQGDLLRAGHLRKPTLIERGEIITVRCLVGGVAITLHAEARTDGSEGDIIECRKRGERATFTARVTGLREAVLHHH